LDSFPGIEAALRASLQAPLPGSQAHVLMGRTPRELRALPFDHDAAVLVLVYPAGAEVLPHVVLTLRAANLRRHRGQVSFPGGLVEPGEDLAAAALREAHEEVGIEPARVELIGELTPLPMPHTGFVLHPFVGLARLRPDLRPREEEVARVLEVPLRELADPSRVREEPRLLGEQIYQVPFFDVAGEKVWGATAMILAELLALLGAPPRPFRHEAPVP
jgi:8-oxo-dGTP pyrophosphatase MutT (NUDIX family)